MRSGRPMKALLEGRFETTWSTLLRAVQNYVMSAHPDDLSLADAGTLADSAKVIQRRVLAAKPTENADE